MTPSQEMAIRSACSALAETLIDAFSASPPRAGPPALLSVVEVAKSLGISRATIYQELDRGNLRSIKIGRRRLVPATAIEEYVDAASPPGSTRRSRSRSRRPRRVASPSMSSSTTGDEVLKVHELDREFTP